MPITSHCLTKWSVWQGVSIDKLLDGIETAARRSATAQGTSPAWMRPGHVM
jgi:hypothetical protein